MGAACLPAAGYLPATRRAGGRRRADPGAGRCGGGPADRRARRRHRAFQIGAAAAGQRVLRPQRPVVPAERRPPADGRRDAGRGAADRPVGGRSEPARRARRIVARAGGRRQRRLQPRRADPADADGRRHGFRRAAESYGAFLLARAGEWPGREPGGAAPLYRDRAGARFQCAAAGPRRDRGGHQRGAAAKSRRRGPGANPGDRAGADERRRIRDIAGPCGGERRGVDHCGADHPVAGVALAAYHHRGGDQHRLWARLFRGARAFPGRRLEPNLGRVLCAVCRARYRFRHPVQCALPRRTPRYRGARTGADQLRTEGGRPLGLGGGGDGARLQRVPADRVSRARRIGRDRRAGDDHRLSDQHHAVAGAAACPEPARRAARDGVCGAGADRCFSTAPPRAGDRRDIGGRDPRLAAARLSALRLQPAASAEPKGGSGRDISRAAPRSADRRQRGRSDQAGSCRGRSLRKAPRRTAGSRADPHRCEFRPG